MKLNMLSIESMKFGKNEIKRTSQASSQICILLRAWPLTAAKRLARWRTASGHPAGKQLLTVSMKLARLHSAAPSCEEAMGIDAHAIFLAIVVGCSTVFSVWVTTDVIHHLGGQPRLAPFPFRVLGYGLV